MNEEQVRKIFREEIAHFMTQSKFVFNRPLQIQDGNDITIGRTVGTRIGSEGSLIAFMGQTPRARFPAGYLIAATGGAVVDVEARARISDINNLLGDSTGFGLAVYP